MRTIKLWVDTGYYGADYEKVIEVEAPSREEAIKEVEMMYYNEEIILDAEDFASKEIY